MQDSVALIKERLSVLDVVGSYVKLTRAGKYWKGLSPFSKEKTPSFFVSPERGLYHCFSSGKGGDMFTFVTEMEGVDFKGALKILAERAGVELVPEAPGVKDHRTRLYAVVKEAESFFVKVLAERPDVQKYLDERQVDQSMRTAFRIGYAPKDWRTLYDHLTALGYTDEEIIGAGLAKLPDDPQKQKRPYDRFRGRIMFPLNDIQGKVIAFSGRIFEDDEKSPGAKYINSPEGMLFDKSRALYGIDVAKNVIRDLHASMLVEGQVDLVLAHKIGFKNAVATSGTACTVHHADLLKRYSPNLLLAYDGDAAGIAAAQRAGLIALGRGMDVKVVSMPKGVDPADMIRTNPEGFKSAVKSAQHIVDYFIAHARASNADERAFKIEVSHSVLPLVAAIPNKIDQAHFVARIGEALSIPRESVMAELSKLGTTAAHTVETSTAAPVTRLAMLERLKEGLDALDTRTEVDPQLLFEAEVFVSLQGDSLAAAKDEITASLAHERYHEELRLLTVKLRAAEAGGDSEGAARIMEELTRLAAGHKH